MELIRVLPEELPQGFCMAGMYAGEKRLADGGVCAASEGYGG